MLLFKEGDAQGLGDSDAVPTSFSSGPVGLSARGSVRLCGGAMEIRTMKTSPPPCCPALGHGKGRAAS